MLDEARRWAETQFGTADLGDARRTHRLVSILAAIARAPDESLPRQLGSLANTQAGDRLFDCGAVTRTAVMDPPVMDPPVMDPPVMDPRVMAPPVMDAPVMDPHGAPCRAAAGRPQIVLMVQDDTILDFSPHRTLKG